MLPPTAQGENYSTPRGWSNLHHLKRLCPLMCISHSQPQIKGSKDSRYILTCFLNQPSPREGVELTSLFLSTPPTTLVAPNYILMIRKVNSTRKPSLISTFCIQTYEVTNILLNMNIVCTVTRILKIIKLRNTPPPPGQNQSTNKQIRDFLWDNLMLTSIFILVYRMTFSNIIFHKILQNVWYFPSQLHVLPIMTSYILGSSFHATYRANHKFLDFRFFLPCYISCQS